jgi:glycosyltransferase involved in cell wall biosynthesis
MYLVSVIIPTYNRAHIIGNAITSAINQTYNHTEIIVIDDGSTDGTPEYVEQFGDKVKYIVQPNSGVSSARNLGIKNSTGELIAFLDSDDEWLPNKLKKQVDFLDINTDFGMVLCDCYDINSLRKKIGRSFRRNHLPNDGNILPDVLLFPSLVPSSVLVKRSVLEDVGYFDESLKTAEDLDIHLRIASKYKIGLICDPLFNYMTDHKDRLSLLSRTYDDHVFVLEKYADAHCANIDSKLIKEVLFKTYIAAANGKFWLQEWRSGFRYALKACKYTVTVHQVLTLEKTWAKCFKHFIKQCCQKIGQTNWTRSRSTKGVTAGRSG